MNGTKLTKASRKRPTDSNAVDFDTCHPPLVDFLDQTSHRTHRICVDEDFLSASTKSPPLTYNGTVPARAHVNAGLDGGRLRKIQDPARRRPRVWNDSTSTLQRELTLALRREDGTSYAPLLRTLIDPTR